MWDEIKKVDDWGLEARQKIKKNNQMYRNGTVIGSLTLLIEVLIFYFWGNIDNFWPNYVKEIFNSIEAPSGAIEFIYYFRIPFDFIGLIVSSILIIHGAWITRSKLKDRDMRGNMIFAFIPSFFYIFVAWTFEEWSIHEDSLQLWAGCFILFLLIFTCLAPTKGLTWTIILSHAILLAIGTIIAGFLPALCWVLPLIIIQFLVRSTKAIKVKKVWLYLSGE